MKTTILIPLFLLLFTFIQAQNTETDSLSKINIQKLDFLAGKWSGNGWMYGQDRNRYEFEQIEDIQFKLDSTTLLIEGLGRSDGKIIHNAMAIVSYNRENSDYGFNSYLANGRKGEFKAELIDDKFYWYPMENMRYIIEINPQGQWFEIGEFNQGDQWFKFFEMTLTKE